MLNPDTLVERSKLRSQVATWRLIVFLGLIIAVAVVFSNKGVGFLTKPYVARIKIDDVISEDQDRLDIIKDIADDKKIKAVIIEVNSPGGTAVGGEELFRALKDLGAKKPTVVVMDSLAASAAYLISVAAERIYAHQGTITGSIGVIMEIPNARDLGEKIGVRMDYIKTSPLKGSPDPFEPRNEQAFAVLHDMMLDFYKFFVATVAKERHIPLADAQKLADGRVFSGQAALQNKLVDQIGNEEDAYNWLVDNKKIAKGLEINEIELSRPKPPLEELLGSIAKNLKMDAFFNRNFGFRGLLL